MMPLNKQEIEKINPDVILKMAKFARSKTWESIYAIKNMMYPGLTEKEAIKIANEYFAANGVKKYWHKTHIRFGEATTLSFNDAYSKTIYLKENDIFYIDAGPVWDGVEGDCGKTFVIGENNEYTKIANDVKVLFDDTLQLWIKTNATGQQLCNHARLQAKKMGYILHPTYVKGHRLSEFSHLKYTKASLFELNFSPSSERWILELQICHPSLKFGAFYEDLLT